MKADFGIMINNHIEKITNSLFAIAPDIFCSRPVLFAYLYGSYSTGNVHPFSDLDIGVYIDDVSDIKYLELELSLSLEIDAKIGSGVRAEVRIINNLSLVIIGNIITKGSLIYSINENVRVDFETSVRKAYFDFLPVIIRYRNTYINSVVC
ncbi:MAG: nucleotidyltransferase domain-containing protein [Deltaproteobacteria bacterium]|nr:nucleotidyltransferase domain-containing protein [Deltaproteobacteria bacterium]